MFASDNFLNLFKVNIVKLKEYHATKLSDHFRRKYIGLRYENIGRE